jgi:hypothetical protein
MQLNEGKMHKNTWTFNICRRDSGELLNCLTFYGIDSEEAHDSCISWAKDKYGIEIAAELTNGEKISRNEEGRKKRFLINKKTGQDRIIKVNDIVKILAFYDKDEDV